MKNLALNGAATLIASCLRLRKDAGRKNLSCLFASMLIAPVALASAPSFAQDNAGAPAARVKVAAVAFDPNWGDLDGNIARLVAGIEDVAKQGVPKLMLNPAPNDG